MTEEKERTPLAGFTKASLLKKKGENLTGIYEGYHIGGKYNSTTHYIILEKGGVQMKSIETEEFDKAKDGDKVGISGTKLLNEKLSGVARGSKISIDFTGWNEFQTKAGEAAREALFDVTVISKPETKNVEADEATVASVLV